MLIKINGNGTEIPEGSLIRDILAGRNLPANVIIIELNGDILHREQWESRKLKTGDSLEIIRLIGGG